MMKFRMAALGAALVLGATTAAVAQPPVTGRPGRSASSDSTRGRRFEGRRPDGRAARGALFRDVQLTDAQKLQLRTVHEKYAAERRTLMTQVRGEPGTTGQRARPDSAARVQVRSLMERETREIRGILTADQQRTFDRNVAATRERVGARHDKAGKRRGPRRPA